MVLQKDVEAKLYEAKLYEAKLYDVCTSVNNVKTVGVSRELLALGCRLILAVFGMSGGVTCGHRIIAVSRRKHTKRMADIISACR